MAPRPTPYPLLERSGERRDQVIDDLVDLFLAEGFQTFSMEEFARRLKCSKTTLYLVASSKEQIVVTTVRAFFRRAASRIEARVASSGDVRERISVYLDAVARELQPASPKFYADVNDFGPANQVYRENTLVAAQRVQDLVNEGVAAGALRPVNAEFVGAAVGQVMTAIQSGAIEAATNEDDAASYRQLADLVIAGIAEPADRSGPNRR